MSINSPYSRDSGMRSSGPIGQAIEAFESWCRAHCGATISIVDYVYDEWIAEEHVSSFAFMEMVADNVDRMFPNLPSGPGYYPALKQTIVNHIGYSWDDIAEQTQLFLECGSYDEDSSWFM
tara:strand:+ start:169 stop:531 length:363 start_codon:yes stop_codon:yes gene_type:complete